MIDIPQYNTFTKIEHLNTGWSGDKKYYIETGSGQKRLLRLADVAHFDRKKAEYEVVQKIAKLGIPMSLPVDFGVCNGGNQVYTVLTWVEGEEATDVLPSLSEERQYALGMEAGRYLQKIHSIPAPKDLPAWDLRFNRKIDRNIISYQSCGVQFPMDDKMIKFVEDNRHLLAGRVQTVQHGDYHVGNMVIGPGEKLGIIDFNRWDYGDPWDEFNRIVFSVNVSIPFAVGSIDGYFDGDVPDVFFRMMALYIASTALSSIPWSIPLGEREVQIAQRNIASMMGYYQGFSSYIPSWYQRALF